MSEESENKKPRSLVGRGAVIGGKSAAVLATGVVALTQVGNVIAPALIDSGPIDPSKLVSPPPPVTPTDEKTGLAAALSELPLGEEVIAPDGTTQIQFPSNAAKMIHTVSADNLGVVGSAAYIAGASAAGAGVGALGGLAVKRRRDKRSGVENKSGEGRFSSMIAAQHKERDDFDLGATPA
jgi:hypothetical protein